MIPFSSEASSPLTACRQVVRRLHQICCDPGRSPEMESIEESLRAIEREVAAGDPIALDRALGRATEIGARIGQLQVSCCAPARMPLYGEALTHLNTLQRVLAGRLGRGH